MEATAPDDTAAVLPGGGGDRRKPPAPDAKPKPGQRAIADSPTRRDAPIKIS